MTSSWIRAMYSPRMPIRNSWIPPRNATKTAIDANPGTEYRPRIFETRNTAPIRNDRPETANPIFNAKRSGAAEKLTIPSVANFTILPSGYFVSPAKRSSRLERDTDLAEADPAEHPAHVAIRLAHRAERVERPAVDEAEVADVERHVDVGHPAKDAVEHRRGQPLERAFAFPLLAHGVDDVVALAPARGQVEGDLGRILEIGVHDDHGIA